MTNLPNVPRRVLASGEGYLMWHAAMFATIRDLAVKARREGRTQAARDWASNARWHFANSFALLDQEQEDA